jgi:hypothetical protein
LTRILAALEEQELINRRPDQAELGVRGLRSRRWVWRCCAATRAIRKPWLGQAIAKNLSRTERGLLRFAVQLL